MPNRLQQQGLEIYIGLYNRLDSQTSLLQACTHPAIAFSDPFCEFQGREALQVYLKHFSQQVIEPRFDILARGWDGDVCLLRWDFSGGLKKPGDWCFPGVSELHFDQEGRVVRHLDHWDSGNHFYARLPLLGGLIRWIKARVGKVDGI